MTLAVPILVVGSAKKVGSWTDHAADGVCLVSVAVTPADFLGDGDWEANQANEDH